MKAGAIEKGQYLLFHNEPYQIVEREFLNPGKGAAFAKCKIKNLINGKVLRETIKTNEEIQIADIHEVTGQYLYADQEVCYFMHTETFEQFSLPIKNIDTKYYYLSEGREYRIIFWESTPIDITLPPKVSLIVSDAPQAIKGDTVSGATKLVQCESGLKIKVPIFIKTGDRILVNSETNEYVERSK
ncbi:hypothetical protein LSH36_583g00061 [Paralvinella palmiformis]|uniref:Elongation factor P n=1 Tax=Paralvinella palmiformis TaxID=53620 RepID=A0AAD9MWV7_9ANNE|nr:hypothetical protein LSH36_583g00061 [Paralvinella palmiformis]